MKTTARHDDKKRQKTRTGPAVIGVTVVIGIWKCCLLSQDLQTQRQRHRPKTKTRHKARQDKTRQDKKRTQRINKRGGGGGTTWACWTCLISWPCPKPHTPIRTPPSLTMNISVNLPSFRRQRCSFCRQKRQSRWECWDPGSGLGCPYLQDNTSKTG